jgi:hypothetical protein
MTTRSGDPDHPSGPGRGGSTSSTPPVHRDQSHLAGGGRIVVGEDDQLAWSKDHDRPEIADALSSIGQLIVAPFLPEMHTGASLPDLR